MSTRFPYNRNIESFSPNDIDPSKSYFKMSSTNQGILQGLEAEIDRNKPISHQQSIPKPRSPSRSKSKSLFKRYSKSQKSEQGQRLIKHINMSSNTRQNEVELMTPLNEDHHHGLYGYHDADDEDDEDDDDDQPGFPDTHSTMLRKKKLKIRSYYIEPTDDSNMQYSYFHSRVKDKLVWYQDIEKLLPSTIPGQLIYFLLNMIFSADLYYSFHRYSFKDGFKSVHRMDDFFTSRRVLSIQNTVPDILPSVLWYKIIKYEPTPYKSMCYYQYVRQRDADQSYKIPVILGYLEFILVFIITFTFCSFIEGNVGFFRINSNIFNATSFEDLLLVKPWNKPINLLCFALIFVTFIHVLCIFIVWRITWFLHHKIKDWKEKIYHCLRRKRDKEIRFIKDLYRTNKNKMHKESLNRIYFMINTQSYLHFKRNGELFISLLKWLNVIEFEHDLDFFTTSKRNWCIITFGLHKYIAIFLFTFVVLFGINIITIILIFIFVISYWIHCIELYTADHHNIKSNNRLKEEYNPNEANLCRTITKILRYAFWPGLLFYAVIAYCTYILLQHSNSFPVVWLGISPIWLIVYSVLTRGYRRIYIFNGLALFALYFVLINWYSFRYKIFQRQIDDICRELASVFLILFQFYFHLSLQFEMHRAMLFPQISLEFKRDETAQKKFCPFGPDVAGAKLYTFVQYAAGYFKKKDISKQSQEKSAWYKKWYNKWYFKRPLQALKVPKARFSFEYKERT